MTENKNDFAKIIVVRNRNDHINHFYFITLDICKLDAQFKWSGLETRVICITTGNEGGVPKVAIYAAFKRDWKIKTRSL